jgi:hypothetical protein
MNANSLLEAPSFRVGRPQFTLPSENSLDQQGALVPLSEKEKGRELE